MYLSDPFLADEPIIKPHHSQRGQLLQSSLVCKDRDLCKKRLNQLRCRLGCGLGWAKELCIRWRAVQTRTENGTLEGDEGRIFPHAYENRSQWHLVFPADCQPGFQFAGRIRISNRVSY